MAGYQVHAMRIAASFQTQLMGTAPYSGSGWWAWPVFFQVQARRMTPPFGVRVMCMASPFQPQVMRMLQVQTLPRMPVLPYWLAGWAAGRCRVWLALRVPCAACRMVSPSLDCLRLSSCPAVVSSPYRAGICRYPPLSAVRTG